MLNLRPEVKKFIDAAETLLSPILLATPFNEDEYGMIAAYVESLRTALLAANGLG